MKNLICSIMALFIFSNVHAQSPTEFNVATAEILPWSISANAEKREIEGYMGELFIGAMKKANLLDKFTIHFVPWKRAQEFTQKTTNTVIFPLTRTEAREPLYKWLVFIDAIETSAWVINPNLKVDTLEDVKKAGMIGGLTGAPQVTEVQKILGADYAGKLDESKDEVTALKKLLLGRIDIFSAYEQSLRYVAKLVEAEGGDAKGQLKNLRKGHVFYSGKLWMAINKDTSDENVEKIRKALQDFKSSADGVALATKYSIKKAATTAQ